MDPTTPSDTRDIKRRRNEASLSHQIPREPFHETVGKHIHEAVYLEIAKRLRSRQSYREQSFSSHWCNNTRLYTLLRMLGHEDGDAVFKRFEREKIGDFWLPIPDVVLDKFSSLALFDVDRFLNTQLFVLSDSTRIDERNFLVPYFERQFTPGPRERTHRYLEYVDSHFEDLDYIAKGSSAEVVRVRHRLSGKLFACKRLPRARPIKHQRQLLELFEQEVRVLERVRHHHIVGLVASFTDFESFSLILDPIADRVLSMLLEQDQPLPDVDIATLRCSFNCLATALEFLHANSVRHKDIKPSNILLNNERILLCDFGISLEWTQSENGTTEGGGSGFTRRYAAPEVFRVDTTRNSKTDIWSLGCVYMEIISAISGHRLNEIDVAPTEEGLSSRDMQEWLEKMRNEQPGDEKSSLPVDWALAMIEKDPRNRPNASVLVSSIHEDAMTKNLKMDFLASCCRRSSCDSMRASITSIQDPFPYAFDASRSYPQTELRDVSRAHPLPGGSSLGQLKDKSWAPMRSSSLVSAPEEPPVSRSSHDRSNAAASGVFSSSHTPVTTPGTSVRTNSASYDTPMRQQIKTEEVSDPTIFARKETRSFGHSFVRICDIQAEEELLYDTHFAFLDIKRSENVRSYLQGCSRLGNTVQIFQTPSSIKKKDQALAPPIGKIIRRIVFCDYSSSTGRGCHNFWLPLVNIQFLLSGAAVTLRWADCNITQRKEYDCQCVRVYDPTQIDNEILVQFHEEIAANEFINKLRFPLEGGTQIYVSGPIEIRTWPGNEATDTGGLIVKTCHNDDVSVVETYAIGRHLKLDVDIIRGRQDINVQLSHILRPIYCLYPSKTSSALLRAGWFQDAKLIPARLRILAPIIPDHTLSMPPDWIATMFKSLTGWDLQYCATVEQVSLERLYLRNKKYGSASVMLWRKDMESTVSASVTFRFPNNEGEIWMSGCINASTTIASTSKTATCSLSVIGRQHGRLLDIQTMTATTGLVPNDSAAAEATFGSQQDWCRIEVRIHNVKHRQAFAGLVEELAQAVQNNPSTPKVNASLAIRPRHLLPSPVGR